MVWEMARWKPKVYVDVPFTPVTFPRNGEITVFIPNSLNPPASKKAKIVFASSFKILIFANKIGVKIKAAPSFANKADTKLPRINA